MLTFIVINRLKVLEENKLGNFEVIHSVHFESAAFPTHHPASRAGTWSTLVPGLLQMFEYVLSQLSLLHPITS